LHHNRDTRAQVSKKEEEAMFENKVGQSFDSLGKRIAYSYLAAYPVFKPVENCGASELSQRQMYDFLYETIENIYNDLSLINVPDEPDDSYEWWQLNKDKPDLILKMRKIEKNFIDFFDYFIKIGKLGEAKDNALFISKADMRIPQKTKERLSRFGLICEESKDSYIISHPKYNEIFPAWKVHSSIPEEHVTRSQNMMNFIHGRFGGKQYTAVEMFGKICNQEHVAELESYFLSKGYTLVNDEMKVMYKKEYPKNQKAFMEIYFDWRKKNQMVYNFKVPHFTALMKSFDSMDDELQGFIVERTKNCDGCGYCIQTDKTGKRQRLALPLKFRGETLVKCPLFPVIGWLITDDAVIRIVKKLFDMAEA
jgi:hypothetical protein